MAEETQQRTTLFIALTLAATLTAISLSSDNKPTFEKVPSSVITLYSKWKAKYGVINSTPSEYTFRLTIFAKNRELLDKYRHENPEASYDLNIYADRTETELNQWLETSVSSEILRRKQILIDKHDYDKVISELEEDETKKTFEISGP